MPNLNADTAVSIGGTVVSIRGNDSSPYIRNSKVLITNEVMS